MNKYKEALWSIDFSMRYRTKPKYIRKVEDENFEILYELVEKATPKKPIEYPSFASGYKCPNCESNIVLHGSHEICPTPCCSWCGQALDWSKEDVD